VGKPVAPVERVVPLSMLKSGKYLVLFFTGKTANGQQNKALNQNYHLR
jgi:hypothetical protein